MELITGKMTGMNDIEKYRKAGEIRKLFEEYRNLARLVDDLDVRFWKRFVMRNYPRSCSIDTELSEENLRREYKSCVTDLLRLREETEEVLDSIASTVSRELILEHYVHDLSMEEIVVKWKLKDWQVSSLIQRGFMEAQLPCEKNRHEGE